MYIIAVFAANKNGKRAAKNRIRIRRERTKKKRKTIPKAKKRKNNKASFQQEKLFYESRLLKIKIGHYYLCVPKTLEKERKPSSYVQSSTR
jgi:hypothetical protein